MEPFAKPQLKWHQLDQLDQVECIAQGGMALIYRAHQKTLNRPIVFKKLKDEYKNNPEVNERFRREARALASLLHQNIAHVYDYVEQDGEAFILMEYIEGIDLSSVLHKAGSLPFEVAAAILLGAARGLNYIHNHGLIHRDVKPANIRITNRGEVKLMDFGIALDTTGASDLTRPGIMVGSPSYLSPEMILGDKVNHQSDIFLLGICFYEMLTGVRPFQAEGTKTVFQAIREGNFQPVRKMRSSVPKPLARIVQKCLQQNPGQRFQNVQEIIHILEQYLGQMSGHTSYVILKFLDREALIDGPVDLEEINRIQKQRQSFSWFAVLTALAFGLFLGYQVAQSEKRLDTPTSYSAPKPIRK